MRTIHIYTQSERKRMVNPIKPYVIDTVLAASFSLAREPEVGHLLENCIFMELCRRDARVTYFTTQSGYEVDFVAEYPDKSYGYNPGLSRRKQARDSLTGNRFSGIGEGLTSDHPQFSNFLRF